MSVIICNRVDKGPHRQEVGVGKVDAGERELGAHHRPREAQGGVQRVLVRLLLAVGRDGNRVCGQQTEQILGHFMVPYSNDWPIRWRMRQ
eukprot:1776540-Pyramimonas_sp.AAC.1